MRLVIATFGIAFLTTACGELPVDPGPDEFGVNPVRALAIPENASLPEPGGANRAERDPFSMAYAALGGSGARQGPMPGRDAEMVMTRCGFLCRLFGGKPAKSGLLDPEAEAERLQALGFAVVTGE